MLTKRQMIVLDVTEMPREIKDAIRSNREHWLSNGSAVFIDVPTSDDIAEYGYETVDEQQISEYLLAEGIEPGTKVLVHYWW